MKNLIPQKWYLIPYCIQLLQRTQSHKKWRLIPYCITASKWLKELNTMKMTLGSTLHHCIQLFVILLFTTSTSTSLCTEGKAYPFTLLLDVEISSIRFQSLQSYEVTFTSCCRNKDMCTTFKYQGNVAVNLLLLTQSATGISLSIVMLFQLIGSSKN